MKDAKGRGAIRKGDKTTHGGKVIEGCDTLKAHGRRVALDGHMTSCPKCKGTFPILAPDSTNKHNGKNIAYDGDPTGCGAKLISSL